MNNIEYVVLVDDTDQEVGQAEKIYVHKYGCLHRAFSIFIFSPDKKFLLIQRRHPQKYHSAGLWANTACGHPRPGENLNQAALRRLQEEMGFSTKLEPLYSFHYKAFLDNNMIENEIDHIFIGKYNGKVFPNPQEVIEYKWIDVEKLIMDIKQHPQLYTYWFKIALPNVIERISKIKE